MPIDLRSSHNSRSRVAELSDLRFVYDQARRYVMARPWERLAGASLYLDLEVGSWLEVCAQHLTNGQNNVVFVFPGHRNMLDFQRAGLSEPPAGTIFIELIDDQSVTPTMRAFRTMAGRPRYGRFRIPNHHTLWMVAARARAAEAAGAGIRGDHSVRCSG